MSVFLVQLLVFSSVVLLVIGLDSMRRGRVEKVSDEGRPGLFGTFPAEIALIGDLVGPSLSKLLPEEDARIHRELIGAALERNIRVREVRGLQIFLGGGLFLAAVFFVLIDTQNPVYALLAGTLLFFLGYFYPPIWLKQTADQRKQLVAKELPFAIDLIAVSMEAGNDFLASVRNLLGELQKGPLQAEFDLLLRETSMGKSRSEAMRSMSDRIQLDEFKAVAAVVIQAAELGTGMAASIKIQAEEIRRNRFHKAERQAARAPSQMLIPVALFILPAVFIVILTPVALRLVGSLRGVQ